MPPKFAGGRNLLRQRSMSHPPELGEAGARTASEDLRATIDEVRSSSQGRTGKTRPHPTPSHFKVIGSGDGGIDELRSKVDDSQVGWGLVRFHAGKGTVKKELLVAMHFFGNSAKPMFRANLGELKPCALRVFGKVSAVIESNHADDITRDHFIGKLVIREESHEWTVNRTIKSVQPPPEEPLVSPQEPEDEKYAPKNGSDALREISDTDGQWNWALFGPNPETMPLVAGGPDSVQGIIAAFRAHPDEVLYGWIRLAFGDEARRQVRRVFIHWIGPGVPPATRFKHSLVKQAMLAKDKGWSVGLDLHAAGELSLDGLLACLKAEGSESAETFTPEEFEKARQVGPPPVPEPAPDDGDHSLLAEVARVRNGPLNWLLLGPDEDWKKHWEAHKQDCQSSAAFEPDRRSPVGSRAFPQGGRLSAPTVQRQFLSVGR